MSNSFSFYSSPNYTGSEADLVFSILGTVLVAVLTVVAVWWAIRYVFGSIGTYTIAKRRGIRHAWLAWIPVIGDWVLGCISDQYQYLVKGKNKSRRTILLVLEIVATVLDVVMVISLISCFRVAFSSAMGGHLTETEIIASLMGPVLSMVWALLLASGVTIAYAVFRYIALYDLYISCNPRNGVAFLVVGIFFNVTEPFFIFACRNRDDGMPPRRSASEYVP